MKLAILLTLDSKSDKKVIFWKKKFKKIYSKLLFVDDVPHLTLIATQVKFKKKGILELEKEIEKSNINFELNILKNDTFNNDLINNGKTFFFKIKKNDKIKKIQIQVAKSIKKNFQLIKQKNTQFRSLEKQNLINYGFPYVGRNWIPHISVCNVIDKNLNKKITKNFLAQKIRMKFKIKKCLICSVVKNKLKILKKI